MPSSKDTYEANAFAAATFAAGTFRGLGVPLPEAPEPAVILDFYLGVLLRAPLTLPVGRSVHLELSR